MDSVDFLHISDAAFGTCDLNQAFADMRQKQAWESQAFVLGHQKACVDRLLEMLTLERQIEALRDQVTTGITDRSWRYSPEAKLDLQDLAKAFVELIHGIEMQNAEQKIKEEFVFPLPLTCLRVVIVLSVVLAVTTMSHELLMQAFGILFGLGCGMALLWEDVLMLSIRLLLGHSVKRLGTFYTQASELNVNLPIAFWQ